MLEIPEDATMSGFASRSQISSALMGESGCDSVRDLGDSAWYTGVGLTMDLATWLILDDGSEMVFKMAWSSAEAGEVGRCGSVAGERQHVRPEGCDMNELGVASSSTSSSDEFSVSILTVTTCWAELSAEALRLAKGIVVFVAEVVAE